MTTETSPKSKKQMARESAFEKQQRQAMIRTTVIVIIGLALLGSVIFYIANETLKGQQDSVRPPANPNEQVIPDEGRSHIDEGNPLVYQHYPPSSGNHYPIWLDPGFYDQPYAEGYWVHSLEHGDVVILYNCAETCPDLTTKLKALIAQAPPRRCGLVRLVAGPYSRGMATPLSVLAWGRQLDLVEFDSEAILNFYKTYEDRGPEVIPCQ